MMPVKAGIIENRKATPWWFNVLWNSKYEKFELRTSIHSCSEVLLYVVAPIISDSISEMLRSALTVSHGPIADVNASTNWR